MNLLACFTYVLFLEIKICVSDWRIWRQKVGLADLEQNNVDFGFGEKIVGLADLKKKKRKKEKKVQKFKSSKFCCYDLRCD